MVYLIARKLSDTGCLAVKVKADKALAGFVSYLSLRTLDKQMEILTVSDMDTYGEYKPYEVVQSEKDFIVRVLDTC